VSRGAFLAALALFVGTDYLPLSRDGAPGGSNFWAPGGGPAVSYQPVRDLRRGAVGAAVGGLLQRARDNAAELVGERTTGRPAAHLQAPAVVAAEPATARRASERPRS
jgi:hypothetical protein